MLSKIPGLSSFFFCKIPGNLLSISRLFQVAQFPGEVQAVPSFLVARHPHGMEYLTNF